jgi:hypothetical protein
MRRHKPYNSEILFGLWCPFRSVLCDFVGGETEVNEFIVLNILRLLEVDFSSHQVIIGILKGKRVRSNVNLEDDHLPIPPGMFAMA